MTVNTLNSGSVSFKGLVWKLADDPVKPFLIAEIRDPERRSVGYSGVSMDTGELLFTVQGSTPDSWWTGLLQAWNGRFFTHGYRDPKFPGQKGVACYDSGTGNLLWKNDDLNFYGLNRKGILLAGRMEDGPQYHLAEPETGRLIEKVDLQTVAALQKEPVVPGKQLPLTRYPEGSTHFSTVSSFIKERVGSDPVAAIEYAEKENYIIISYYASQDSHLANYILLAGTDGELLFHDRTATGLSGTGFDNFIITKDRLIYVKDKKEVVFLNL